MRRDGKRNGGPTGPSASATDPLQTETVIGYVRVSTTEQADTGISLDAQRHRLQAYCDAHGLVLARIEEDAGISAKTVSKRPGLQRALKALRKGDADGLVAVKLDRLSRTTRDVLDLVTRSESERWALHSIDERLDTSSPQGRFTVTILAALAQLEREQAAERTKTAMAELRRQWRRVSGRPPFGYRFDGGDVVPVEEEQEVLRRMLALRDAGHGPAAIVRELDVAGIVNPRTGKPWTRGNAHSVLQRAAAG